MRKRLVILFTIIACCIFTSVAQGGEPKKDSKSFSDGVNYATLIVSAAKDASKGACEKAREKLLVARSIGNVYLSEKENVDWVSMSEDVVNQHCKK